MPLYDYQCLYCGDCDLRVAGVNDYMTICTQCGNIMLRLVEALFWPLLDVKSGPTQTGNELRSFSED